LKKTKFDLSKEVDIHNWLNNSLINGKAISNGYTDSVKKLISLLLQHIVDDKETFKLSSYIKPPVNYSAIWYNS
jgi:hypothetical protein